MNKKKKKKKKTQTNRPRAFFCIPMESACAVWTGGFIRESSIPHSTHIHSVCIIPPTNSMLPGKTFLDIEPVVRCIPVYPRSHLPEDQHLSRTSATPFHGFVFTLFDAWNGILMGADVSERLCSR